MIDPTTAILASAASNIPGMILGGIQLAKSNRLNPVRPEYEIPESERRALELAESMASQTRLPGQSAIEGRLDQTTANTLATIERMGYGGASDINAASRAYGNQLEKETDLGISAAGFRQQNQRNLENALTRMGTYEDKKWQLNEYQPFVQESQAKAALYEGGMQNLMGGFKDTAGGISNLLLADALYSQGYKQPRELPALGTSFTPPQDTGEVYDLPQGSTQTQVSTQTSPNELLGIGPMLLSYLPQSPTQGQNRYRSIFDYPIQ